SPAQAQMRVDHLQLRAADVDRDPDRAARLADRGEGRGPHQPRRQRRQDGIAILLLFEMERRMEMGLHAQMRGDEVGLVDAAGAGPADIDLLKRGDVGLATGDDLRDAGRIAPPVRAAAGVDVVGQYPDVPQRRAGVLSLSRHGRGNPRAPASVPLPTVSPRERQPMAVSRLLLPLLVIAALFVAAVLLYRALSRYTLDEIVASAGAIPASRLVLAAGFAAASYLCLTFFDWLGLRYAGRPLAWRQAALASFVGLSIGHNVGLAALSSGAIRYRFYARWGLGAGDVAKVILFCGITVGLGLAVLGG